MKTVAQLQHDVKSELKWPGQRSDADIARSVQKVLQWLVALPLDTVKATVEHGHVTLSGQVEWQYQKDAAVAAVGPVLGVRAVTDHVMLAG